MPTYTKNKSVENATQLDAAKSKPVRNQAQRALLHVVSFLEQIIEHRMEIVATNLSGGSSHTYHNSGRATKLDYTIDAHLAIRAALQNDRAREAEFWKWFQTKITVDEKYRGDARPWTSIGLEFQRRGLDDVGAYFRSSHVHKPARQQGATTASIRKRYEALQEKEWARLRDAALVQVHTQESAISDVATDEVKPAVSIEQPIETVGHSEFDFTTYLTALFITPSPSLVPLWGMHRAYVRQAVSAAHRVTA